MNSPPKYILIARHSQEIITFTQPQEAQDAAMEPSEKILQGCHVLVADDSEENRLLVQYILEPKGAHIRTANNGKEAIQIFTHDLFDVVLMDINMPILDGLQATQLIRSYEKEAGLKHTPIIALTAHASKEDKEKFLLAGHDLYLAKPFRGTHLVDLVASCLDHKEVKH